MRLSDVPDQTRAFLRAVSGDRFEAWETASSVELAERLYDEAVSRAISYCSQIGELGDVTISEEVKEASKRAFWYPHPDDPPNH